MSTESASAMSAPTLRAAPMAVLQAEEGGEGAASTPLWPPGSPAYGLVVGAAGRGQAPRGPPGSL